MQLHKPPGQRQTEPGPFPLLPVPDLRTCWNSSKIRPWCSGAMPMPVSHTVMRTPAVSSSPALIPTCPPSGVNLTALERRLKHHLLDLALVGLDDVEGRVHYPG